MSDTNNEVTIDDLNETVNELDELMQVLKELLGDRCKGIVPNQQIK